MLKKRKQNLNSHMYNNFKIQKYFAKTLSF